MLDAFHVQILIICQDEEDVGLLGGLGESNHPQPWQEGFDAVHVWRFEYRRITTQKRAYLDESWVWV